jgi:hypothetical protein
VKEFNVRRFNKKVFNISFNIVNEEGRDTVANFTFHLFAQVDLVIVYLKLSVPIDNGDERYGRVIINAKINCNKVIDGFRGFLIIQPIYEALMRSIDFELKYPFAKVS